MGLIDDQLLMLKMAHPEASVRLMPDAANIVTIPQVALPEGWSSTHTTIRFYLAPNYPFGKPDCFWADVGLKLKNGAQPQNSALQPIPGTTEPLLWFSWHASHWNPNNDSLITYMNVIRDRLKKAQ